MKILKKILIKQVITEKSKEQIRDRFHEDKMRLEQESQQLLFEKRKLQNKPGISKHEVNQRFQKEINKREESIELIEFKEDQLDHLEIGSEIVEGEVESLVEVSVGDNWDNLKKKQAIVIKDNVVIRIDE